MTGHPEPPPANDAELLALCRRVLAGGDVVYESRSLAYAVPRLLAENARLRAGDVLSALVSGVLCDARDIPVPDRDDVKGLHAGLRRLLAERDALRAELAQARGLAGSSSSAMP